MKVNQNMHNANLSYASTEPIKCEKCDSEVFQPAFILRKVSALVSPTGKETIVPVQLFACISCGHVNEDMYPIE